MIVVDSAALVDALGGIRDADALRDQLAREDLHAPTLVDFEVVSALRRLTLTGALGGERAEDLLADFEDLVIRRWPFIDPFRRRALALRHNLSAYDAAYVTLAEVLACPLVTRDGRLARSTGHDARIEVR